MENNISLERITEMWEEDSKLDWDILDQQTLANNQLHSKYYKIFQKEKLIFDQLQSYYDQLKFLRYMFYLGKLSEEQIKNNNWLDEWKALGKKVLKSEVDMFLNADKHLEPVKKDIHLCAVKIEKLKSILDEIKWRPQSIKTALEVRKFKEGIS